MEELEKKLVEIIQNNYHLVHENYNNKEDQVLLDKKLVTLLDDALKSHLSERTHRHSTLKIIIRKLFELSKKDILLVKDGYIFLKYVSQIEQTIPKDRKSTNQARYNGYPQEEMEAFYTKFFPQEQLDSFLKEVAFEFVTNYIIKKQISNAEYEQKVFGIIKNIVYQKLLLLYENQDEFMLGLAGYIFRINFEKVFYYIAELLLEKMVQNDTKVLRFIEYYTHEIIVLNGSKYQVPAIVTADKKQWKTVSILAVVRTYINAKMHIKQIYKKIQMIQQKLKEFQSIDGKTPLEKQKKLQSSIIALQKSIEEKHEKLLEYKKYLQDNTHLSSLEKSSFRKKIFYLNEEIEKLQKEQNEYKNILLPHSAISQFQALQKELNNLQKELQNKKRVLEQNKTTYEAITQALVRSLIQKKKKLS